MGIKVLKKDNKIIAKGIPKISEGAILTGILILILCLFVSSSPAPMNVLAIAIFAIMIIIGGLIHAIKERKKAIREYNKKEIQVCSKCGASNRLNSSFCGKCGFSL